MWYMAVSFFFSRQLYRRPGRRYSHHTLYIFRVPKINSIYREEWYLILYSGALWREHYRRIYRRNTRNPYQIPCTCCILDSATVPALFECEAPRSRYFYPDEMCLIRFCGIGAVFYRSKPLQLDRAFWWKLFRSHRNKKQLHRKKKIRESKEDVKETLIWLKQFVWTHRNNSYATVYNIYTNIHYFGVKMNMGKITTNHAICSLSVILTSVK